MAQVSNNLILNNNITKAICYEKVFNNDECKYMISEVLKIQQNIASKLNYKDNVNKTLSTDINNIESLKSFIEQIRSHIVEANKIFNFNIDSFREVIFLNYEKDAYMSWHKDIGENKVSEKKNIHSRKITISLLLSSEEDYDGGELLFTPDIKMKQTQGSIIAYPSYMVHCVKKIERGNRYSIIASANGPNFR
jgi:predicted 2-oxoglutarate/Fe(II)-dependent dioxygenase YbiX